VHALARRRGPSIPEAAELERRGRGVLDASPEPVIRPAKGRTGWRGMTSGGCESAFSRHDLSEFFHSTTLIGNRGRREGRVTAAPMAPVRKKCTGQEPQVRADQPAFPAQWVDGLYVLSPVTRRCCHRRQRDAKHHRQLDASPGAPGPHDFAVRIMLLVRQHIAAIASRSLRP
jgi:hypothetical protein